MPVGGRPMLAWAIDALHAAGVGEIVVALPADLVPAGAGGLRVVGDDAGGSGSTMHAGVMLPGGYVLPPGVRTVQGGRERSHSVQAALLASTGDPLIVHDAARPLVTPELISLAVAALDDDPGLAAAIVATPVTDTIKRSFDGVHADETLARAELWAVQTPQVFRREWLERALAAGDELLATATDDASLVESLGGRVGLVPAGPENLKVTTAHDLRVAELLLAERRGDV